MPVTAAVAAAGQDVMFRKEAGVVAVTVAARSRVDVTATPHVAYTAVTVADVENDRPPSRHSYGQRVPGGGAGKRAHTIVAAALRLASSRRDKLQAATVAVVDQDGAIVYRR